MSHAAARTGATACDRVWATLSCERISALFLGVRSRSPRPSRPRVFASDPPLDDRACRRDPVPLRDSTDTRGSSSPHDSLKLPPVSARYSVTTILRILQVRVDAQGFGQSRSTTTKISPALPAMLEVTLPSALDSSGSKPPRSARRMGTPSRGTTLHTAR